MLTRAVRRIRTAPLDAGLTLSELVVSMSLMSLMGALALGFFVGTDHAANRTADESQATAQARVALSSAVQVLQLADSPTPQPGAAAGRFETITATRVVFYSNRDNRPGAAARTAPDKVVLTTAGGSLVEQVFKPKVASPADYTTNYASSPSVSRTLVASLTGASGFSYCSSKVDAAGTCIPTASPTAVAAVVVTLVVPGQRGGAAQTFTSTASITGTLQ